jgi:hypothetical protein
LAGFASEYKASVAAAFLAVADEACSWQFRFAFLERMRDGFLQKFAEKDKAAAPQSLMRTFGYTWNEH